MVLLVHSFVVPPLFPLFVIIGRSQVGGKDQGGHLTLWQLFASQISLSQLLSGYI